MIATKIRAPISGWPTRDRALLIADPSPEFRPGIEPISVLVRGATTIAIPSAERDADRQDVDQGVRPAGSSVAGPAEVGLPTAPTSAGIRASQSWPAATISGPATRKIRDPESGGQAADPGRQQGDEEPGRQADDRGTGRAVAERPLVQQGSVR